MARSKLKISVVNNRVLKSGPLNKNNTLVGIQRMAHEDRYSIFAKLPQFQTR